MSKRFLVVCVFFLLVVSTLGPLSFGYKLSEKEILIDNSSKPQSMDGPPMDSPWPMYCHDVRHTGRSLHSTNDNPYDVKWMFDIYGPVWGGPVIDEEGIIYIGSDSVYAIYPNGTLKWRYNDFIRIASSPAIGDDGSI
jgi:outer membrane protein assembly factor BamB